MIDIGRVFSTSFAMFRQRFWLLVAMWAVFFAIQFVASSGLFLGVAVLGLAGSVALGAGLDDPASLTGMGAGMMVFLALFYAAYLALLLAQQASLVTLASPLHRPSFGEALLRGFKSAIPFLGLTAILILGYFGLSLGMVLVIGTLSFAGEGVAGLIGGLAALLFLPVIIYLLCRLSVVVAVVAVDQVYNPINALRRTWSLTAGKVIGILLALIGAGLLGLAVLGVPVALMLSVALSGDTGTAAVMAFLGLLLLVPLAVVFSLFFAAITAALHSEVTDGGAAQLEEVFA